MIGKTVSHYQILGNLGNGAMGTVYKAHDLKLDRMVAIKVMSPTLGPLFKARFTQEAKAASSLDHVNICTIHELGETEDGQLFIAMTYCPGQNLRSRLKLGRLALAQAVDIAAQVGRGLAKAHSLGVLHRDIKPGNIMITPDGIAKIVDFGLAKIPADLGLTSTGAILGTLPYMSPEQLTNKSLDGRTDLWSLGVVTYEMLVGQLPFVGDSQFQSAEAILNAEPVALSKLRPEIPFELESIVLRALRKNPQDRQSDANEFVRSLCSVSSLMNATTSNRSAPQIASIAVLPFINLNSEADSEYLSDGLTEELIHVLSQLPNLRVVSRTSAFELKGKPQGVRQTGEQLKVSTIVEGSVRKVGQKLRIRAELVNVADGYCLWSQRFDQDMKDIFEIQDEIARTIVDTLKVRLGSKTYEGLIKRRTYNLQAYDLYLRGRFHWNKRSGDGLERALAYFEMALAEDPYFAPGYSGIADFHVAVASWGLARPTAAWPKAKAAAERALELDDNSAEAHASIGTVRMWYEWNWGEAEREFLRAIELNPGHPNARIQYNLLLLQTGRFVEAEHEIRAALSSDPLSVRANSYLAGLFHYRREYDRSLEQCRYALDLDPEDIELRIVLALNYEQKRMYSEAIRELDKARELSGNNPLLLGPLGSCYAAVGEKAHALQLIDELNRASQSTYVAPITWAMVYLSLREKDLAFEWLEKAARQRDVLLCYLGVGPIYDCIREDPRYGDLVRRIGLSPGAQQETLSA
jgi:eukaryotic-like serine/threonine-protein kinase